MRSARGLTYWAVKEMTCVPTEEYRLRKADYTMASGVQFVRFSHQSAAAHSLLQLWYPGCVPCSVNTGDSLRTQINNNEAIYESCVFLIRW